MHGRDVKDLIAQSERDGGIWLKNLRIGDVLRVQTKNTLYTITKRKDDFTIEGHKTYCPQPVSCHIAGSTWGGSAIKVGFVGKNMHLELRIRGVDGTLTTTPIRSIVTDLVH